MSDPYAYWNSVLDGRPIDLQPGRAECGYWRRRTRNGSWEGLFVWRQPNGQIAYQLGDREAVKLPTKNIRSEAEFVEQIFGSFAKHAVEVEAFTQYRLEGTWPDMPEDVTEAVAAGIGHNAPPEIVLDQSVGELLEEARKWFESIGAVTTQAQADKAANYADRFAEWKREGDERHKAEKAPVLQQARDIDEKWRAPRDAADKATRWAKSLVAKFLAAEKARKAAEAATMIAEGGKVKASDLKATAGTRGRAVSTRVKRVGLITDQNAFVQHLLQAKNPELLAVLDIVADRFAMARIAAPGMEIREEQAVA